MRSKLNESIIENSAFSWFVELGYSAKSGPEIAPGELFAERTDWGVVVLERRLRESLFRINP